jgi:plasmid stability protein
MADITIPDLDDSLLAFIEQRAAARGLSVEEEVRELLTSTYSDNSHEIGARAERETR